MAETNKYARGKVYKIISNNIPDVYIGSTCEPMLASRLAKHKGGFKLWKSGKRHYTSSYEILEQNHYEIILIELYPCNSKDELHKRERYYIEQTPNCVNKRIPSRTHQESSKIYRENHKDVIKGKNKIYREQNKDAISDKGKVYCEQNKNVLNEKKKIYRENHKDVLNDKNKIYRESNKDKIKAKNKIYREANKDKIKAYYDAHKDAINKRKRDKRALLKSNQK